MQFCHKQPKRSRSVKAKKLNKSSLGLLVKASNPRLFWLSGQKLFLRYLSVRRLKLRCEGICPNTFNIGAGVCSASSHGSANVLNGLFRIPDRRCTGRRSNRDARSPTTQLHGLRRGDFGCIQGGATFDRVGGKYHWNDQIWFQSVCQIDLGRKPRNVQVSVVSRKQPRRSQRNSKRDLIKLCVDQI